MADVSKNNPMKEFAFALGGTTLFLGIVLLIGVSAFLRPAGEHIVVKSATDDEVVGEVIAPDAGADNASEAAPAADGDNTGSDNADTATAAADNAQESAQAPTATEDQQATDDLLATTQAVDVDEAADTAHEQAADAEAEASTAENVEENTAQ